MARCSGREEAALTYAPDDLKAVQTYCRNVTGQSWESLGIIHSTPQGGGYHEGRDLLAAAGRAPGGFATDYSWVEAARDLNGLDDAGSAFDLGGGFARFREITLGIVSACERGDPRTNDVREVIYTPDGYSVRRWDRLGRRDSGDDSHLYHTHISFFRDSEGRRANADNFLGLLIQLFEGRAVQTEEDDDMPAGIPTTEIPLSGVGSFTIWPVNSGAAGYGPAWLNLCNDTLGQTYGLRIWGTPGDGSFFPIQESVKIDSGVRVSYTLPTGTAALSIARIPAQDGGQPYQGQLTFSVEYGRR
jgi:hypothetical protein